MVKEKKKVTISSAPPRVHLLYKWFSASKEARIGDWQLYAIERMHFNKRIQNIENCISYVFTPTHRQKMFNKIHGKGF